MCDLPGQRCIPNTTAELQQNAKRLRSEMTPAEQLLWNAPRNKRLIDVRFRRQHPVATFVLDFYCPAAHLAIEIDGSIYDDPNVAEHDAVRQQTIEAFGITVPRFSNDVIKNHLNEVLEKIRLTVDQLSNH